MRMMMIGIVGVLTLVSCGPGKSAVIGVWKGSVDLGSEEQPLVAALEGFANALSKGIELEIRRDHTYALTALMFKVSGTWTWTDGVLRLVPESASLSTEDGTKNEALFQFGDVNANEEFTLRIERVEGERRLVSTDPTQRGFSFAKAKKK